MVYYMIDIHNNLCNSCQSYGMLKTSYVNFCDISLIFFNFFVKECKCLDEIGLVMILKHSQVNVGAGARVRTRARTKTRIKSRTMFGARNRAQDYKKVGINLG